MRRIAVLVTALVACGPDGPQVKRPDIVVERRACLADAPPVPPRGIVWQTCDPGQPKDDACSMLDDYSARLFLPYLTRLTRYARDAWTNCGPLPAKGSP